jgi:hypothetical protein
MIPGGDSESSKDDLEAPEVVPEAIPKVVRETAPPYYREAGETGNPSKLDSARQDKKTTAKTGAPVSEPGTKAKTNSVAVEEAVPVAPQPQESLAPSPSPTAPDVSQDRLARHYFEQLGQPAEHRKAARLTWPSIFKELLQVYSETDLVSAMEWAFDDDFWFSKLDQPSKNPAAYFAKEASQIMPRWRHSCRVKAKREQSTAPPANSASAPQREYTKAEQITLSIFGLCPQPE